MAKRLVILSEAKNLRREGFGVRCSVFRKDSSSAIDLVLFYKRWCWPPEYDIGRGVGHFEGTTGAIVILRERSDRRISEKNLSGFGVQWPGENVILSEAKNLGKEGVSVRCSGKQGKRF